MLAAKQRLQGYRSIDFLQLGLSDSNGELDFDPLAGSASAVGQTGSHKISVCTLDSQRAGPVSFIKMDLEGWELNALEGCKNHIAQHQPKLAIAVYHQACHFRQVWKYVRALNKNYKVYLRHYTQGWSETVMFFVPQEKGNKG